MWNYCKRYTFRARLGGSCYIRIFNTTPLPAKIYANEGVAQFVFLKGNEKPRVTYAKRKGKYMKQKGVTLPKV